MSSDSWRNRILQDFTPQVARLTLVADPDKLLGEETALQAIRERGFELLDYDDPISFRFAYESQYRTRWEQGDPVELVVIVQGEASELTRLPYDLWKVGRKLAYSLSDLFPNLNYQVVAALDKSDLEPLYQAQVVVTKKLGYNQTCDFLLERVFPPHPSIIHQPHELLRTLIQRHYANRRLPPMLDSHFIEILRRNQTFKDWPLEEIVPDRAAFFQFLQHQWLPFVQDWLDQQHIPLDSDAEKHFADQAAIYYPSQPLGLPFAHPDVRVLMDNLFLEGFLKPLELPGVKLPAWSPGQTDWWMGLGLKVNQELRLQKLIEKLEQTLPAADLVKNTYASYKEWLAFAYRWAELANLWRAVETPNLEQRYRALQVQIDDLFESWVVKRYNTLYNLSALQPVMLHQIPGKLYNLIASQPEGKVALVVIDGLALEQWLALREVLLEQEPTLICSDEAIFAWIPTLTSVSRQAAFSGKTPNLYSASIQNTSKEETLWRQFWEEHGFNKTEICYLRGLGSDTSFEVVEEALAHPKVRVAGLVVNQVDDIMHGITSGSAGMEREVRNWATQGFMQKMLNRLLDGGFNVFLTSDHGNIEAIGIGNTGQGSLVDQAGERVRVYNSPELRRLGKELFPMALEWDSNGLPPDYLPLLAPGRSAFVIKDKHLVAHGGISVEELIVPYIKIERKAER